MAELITQSEYARRRGVAKSAVARAVAEQRIRLIDGKVDPEVADIQWANNTRARADSARRPDAAAAAPEASPSVDKPGPGGKPTSYNDDRARREKADADRAELLAQREAQLLLQREPTERAVFDAFRGLRDAAFQAMRDAAPKVRDMNEPREIQLALEEELRTAFQNFETATRKRLAELAAESRP